MRRNNTLATPGTGPLPQERALSLSQSDLLKLLRTLANPRDKAIIHLLVGLGCGITELTRLRVSDVQQDGVHIMSVREPEKIARVVPVDEIIAAVLDALIADRPGDASLLVSREGGGLTRRRIEQILALASRRLDQKVVGKTISRTAGLAALGQKSLDAQQVAALMTHTAKTSAAIPVRLLLETGCTVAELVALRVGDFDLEGRILTIPAGWSRRVDPVRITLTARTCELVRSRLRRRALVPKDVLFSKRTNPNQGLSTLRIQQMLKGFDEAVGFHVTPSVLRATRLRTLIEKGIPAREICARLGLRRLPQF